MLFKKQLQLFPAAMSLALVSAITAILWLVDAKLGTDHLIFIYLVPTSFIAIRYGSVSAMIAIIASDLAAAYFLYPPKLSLTMANGMDIAELVLFTMLAVLAAQVVSALAEDSSVDLRKR